MYQPKIRDDLIRKLYFRARREQKKMTCLLNDLLEEVLTGEPEPPPYSETEQREGDPVKRKELVWLIERKLIEDAVRPTLFFMRQGTCWQPQVKGLTLMDNSIFNSWRMEDVWLDR